MPTNYNLGINTVALETVLATSYGTNDYPTVISYPDYSPYRNRFGIAFGSGGYPNNTKISGCVGNKGYTAYTGVSINTWYDITVSFDGTTIVTSVNGTGTSTSASGAYNPSSNTKQMYIFAESNQAGTAVQSGTFLIGELNKLIITQNGTLVRNFVPCYCTTTVTGYKGSTAVSCPSGTIGLFDLVNSRFYVNSGSGTFTKGADV